MMTRIFSFIAVLLFVLGISTPGMIWIFSDTQEISKQEKRRLTPLPDLNLDKDFLNQYPKKFNAYFNDHYGLRTTLVDLNRYWQANVFNKSSIRPVIRGENDWLFFDAKRSLNDHVGLIKLRENVLPDWKQNLLDKQKWLKNLGIEYLFIPVPNKMTIYPEFLPYRIRKRAGSTMLDKLLMTLKADQQFQNFVELEPFLRNKKYSGPEKLQTLLGDNITTEGLYSSQDTHWTVLGAFLSYQHIMNQLRKILPTLEPALPFSQIKLKRVERLTDLGMMSSIFEVEHQHHIKPINPCAPKKTKPLSSFTKVEAYKLNPRKIPTITGCKNKSLRAVIAHDSFGAYLQPFFAESFQEVVFMHSYDLVGMKNFLHEFDPDVYIEVRVERNVKYLLAPDKRLQQAVAALEQTLPKQVTH